MPQKIFSIIAFIAISFISFTPIAIAVEDKPLVDVQELLQAQNQFMEIHLYIPQGRGNGSL